jgi:hypothetical protein
MADLDLIIQVRGSGGEVVPGADISFYLDLMQEPPFLTGTTDKNGEYHLSVIYYHPPTLALLRVKDYGYPATPKDVDMLRLYPGGMNPSANDVLQVDVGPFSSPTGPESTGGNPVPGGGGTTPPAGSGASSATGGALSDLMDAYPVLTNTLFMVLVLVGFLVFMHFLKVYGGVGW